MILENQSLYFENVLSYRTRVASGELIKLLRHVYDSVGEMKLTVTDDLILSVYETVPAGSDTILGVELIIPVEQPFESNCRYVFKPFFRIENALLLNCCGRISQLSEARRALHSYALDNNYPVLTRVYYVIRQFSEDYIAANAYLGINGNML